MTEPLSTNHLFISKLTKFSEYPDEDADGPLVINYM